MDESFSQLDVEHPTKRPRLASSQATYNVFGTLPAEQIVEDDSDDEFSEDAISSPRRCATFSSITMPHLYQPKSTYAGWEPALEASSERDALQDLIVSCLGYVQTQLC